MQPFYSIVFLLVFVACETIVDVEVPREAPKLVMNATVTPGDRFLPVFITQSRYVLDDTEFKRVNNATVSLFEDGIFVKELEKSSIHGMYTVYYWFDVAKTYTLKAEAPGFTPIEATTSFHNPVPIQAITLETAYAENNSFCFGGPCPEQENYKVNLTFQDPANTYNYYSVVAFVGEFNRNENSISYSDTYIPLSSEDVSLALSEFNLEGIGYRGYELWFTDDIFDGQAYTFSFEIAKDNYSDLADSVVLGFELRHQTEANFKYHTSKRLQNLNDGNPFAEPTLIYDNIENGHGIFASYTPDSKTVAIP